MPQRSPTPIWNPENQSYKTGYIQSYWGQPWSPKNELENATTNFIRQCRIFQFKVAPNFGTFAPLFDPPLAAYFDTPHMYMYSSGF